MAGTVTITRQKKNYAFGDKVKLCELVTIDWVGDAADGSVPNTTLDLNGFLVKALTNPGSTAPTDNYGIAIGDSNDSSVDVLAGALANRDTANTEIAYPLVASSNVRFFFDGSDYVFKLSGNSVNSATGRVILTLTDEA